MNNKEINKLLIEIAKSGKKKYYYKRTGKCDPSKCSAACCRYALAPMFEDSYFQKVTQWFRQPIQTIKFGKIIYVISAFHCPEITVDGRCKLHGTSKQSEVCDKFPMDCTGPVYKYIKKYCSYKFRKVLIDETAAHHKH